MVDNETVIGRLGENAPEVFNRAFLKLAMIEWQ